VIEVLVVDDDFMVAKIHSGFVERTPGFAVVGLAHTGADALRAARRLRPDLVLLDIYLPDMTGLEVLQRLREEAPDVDVLVITAAREADTVRRALRGGVVHYLLKPFGYDDLRARLEHYTSAHRGLSEAETAQQADVDRVFGTRALASRSLPKGLSPGDRPARGGRVAAADEHHVRGRVRAAGRRLAGERPPLPGAFRGSRQGRGAAALWRRRSPRTALRVARALTAGTHRLAQVLSVRLRYPIPLSSPLAAR
jgi:response regulator of citrate/malate metabolism